MLKAAKRNVKAFTAVSAKREAIENRRRAEREELRREVLEYKMVATQELRWRKEACVSGPEIIPHPDDIEINPITGSIVINGPTNLDQKMAQDLYASLGPVIERMWRNSPLFIAKDRWHLRLHARFKRRLEIVGRLVAMRASRINSWDNATRQQRIDFMRRSLEEEQQACLLEVRKI
jgi:hypothetical protein